MFSSFILVWYIQGVHLHLVKQIYANLLIYSTGLGEEAQQCAS